MPKTHDYEYAYRGTWDREPRGRCRVRILEADGQVPVLVVTELNGNTGTSVTNMPNLARAMAECRKCSVPLVIAKLDRMARNVAFVSALMESGIDFAAADMPGANRLTIHVATSTLRYPGASR